MLEILVSESINSTFFPIRECCIATCYVCYLYVSIIQFIEIMNSSNHTMTTLHVSRRMGLHSLQTWFQVKKHVKCSTCQISISYPLPLFSSFSGNIVSTFTGHWLINSIVNSNFLSLQIYGSYTTPFFSIHWANQHSSNLAILKKCGCLSYGVFNTNCSICHAQISLWLL